MEKKKSSLIKMKKAIENINYSGSQKEFDMLQNMLIRYLLRNIYFFESAKRKEESDLVLSTREVEIPAMVGIDNSLRESLNIIINSKDYNNILNSISKSNNRKKEISMILKQYK